MVLVVDIIWDTLVFAVSIVVFFYLYRARRLFAGGAVGRVTNYFMAAMIIACAAFGFRIALDALNINPEMFLVSLRDLGSVLVLTVLLLGLREGAKLWSTMNAR